jgi:carbonic anhydrase
MRMLGMPTLHQGHNRCGAVTAACHDNDNHRQQIPIVARRFVMHVADTKE